MTETLSDLSVSELYAGYHPGIDILRGIDLTTRGVGITVIVGPNGAGKSTLLRTMFGLLGATHGAVALNGTEITNRAPQDIKRLGVSYIAQGINIFPQLTVDENLRMGAWVFRGDRERVRTQLEAAYDLFPALKDIRRRRAHELSGGQAKMLSIAKEVMTQPSVILVDEPTAGLAPARSREVYEFLVHTREATKSAIVLVDQNIEGAIAIADRVYLLDLGRVRHHGPRAEFGLDRVRALIHECLLG